MPTRPYVWLARGKFDLLRPDPALIDYEELVSTLARICRYGGRCRTAYSVGQHSVHAAEYILDRYADRPDVYEAAMVALMHDAAEYITSDFVTTVKQGTFFYDDEKDAYVNVRDAEKPILVAIGEALNVPVDHELLFEADTVMLCRELIDLTTIDPKLRHVEYAKVAETLPPITCWGEQTTRLRFNALFGDLRRKL